MLTTMKPSIPQVINAIVAVTALAVSVGVFAVAAVIRFL
jgi:hypothetical protein